MLSYLCSARDDLDAWRFSAALIQYPFFRYFRIDPQRYQIDTAYFCQPMEALTLLYGGRADLAANMFEEVLRYFGSLPESLRPRQERFRLTYLLAKSYRKSYRLEDAKNLLEDTLYYYTDSRTSIEGELPRIEMKEFLWCNYELGRTLQMIGHRQGNNIAKQRDAFVDSFFALKSLPKRAMETFDSYPRTRNRDHYLKAKSHFRLATLALRHASRPYFEQFDGPRDPQAIIYCREAAVYYSMQLTEEGRKKCYKCHWTMSLIYQEVGNLTEARVENLRARRYGLRNQRLDTEERGRHLDALIALVNLPQYNLGI